MVVFVLSTVCSDSFAANKLYLGSVYVRGEAGLSGHGRQIH